jgi:hypothetical protein
MPTLIRPALAAIALAASLSLAQAQAPMHRPGQPAMAPGGQHPMMGGAEHLGMKPMMSMAMDHGGIHAGGLMGLMQPHYLEGRIAFLKAELKITDAQAQQWTAFAAALRQGAGTVGAAHDGKMDGMRSASAPERAEREVTALSARLDVVKAVAAAEAALYGVMTQEQKTAADEMLASPMGCPMGGPMGTM